MNTRRPTYGERAWAPPNPFGFNGKVPKGGRPAPRQMPGSSLNGPPQFAPDCPTEERQAALEALAKMHQERPLRPPGK